MLLISLTNKLKDMLWMRLTKRLKNILRMRLTKKMKNMLIRLTKKLKNMLIRLTKKLKNMLLMRLTKQLVVRLNDHPQELLVPAHPQHQWRSLELNIGEHLYNRPLSSTRPSYRPSVKGKVWSASNCIRPFFFINLIL